MPKQFYTERDIEDLFNRGTKSLQVTDEVVLTELAYEKAKRLGLQLITNRADNPPAAPVRPYLSEEPSTARPQSTMTPASQTISQPVRASTTFEHQSLSRESAIEQRIRSAVIAKLGDQVDAKLLDNIVHRVVKGIGLK
jgi:RNA:NAD 2'-phosphotransferase (TPT1/KptA family)